MSTSSLESSERETPSLRFEKYEREAKLREKRGGYGQELDSRESN